MSDMNAAQRRKAVCFGSPVACSSLDPRPGLPEVIQVVPLTHVLFVSVLQGRSTMG